MLELEGISLRCKLELGIDDVREGYEDDRKEKGRRCDEL